MPQIRQNYISLLLGCWYYQVKGYSRRTMKSLIGKFDKECLLCAAKSLTDHLRKSSIETMNHGKGKNHLLLRTAGRPHGHLHRRHGASREERDPSHRANQTRRRSEAPQRHGSVRGLKTLNAVRGSARANRKPDSALSVGADFFQSEVNLWHLWTLSGTRPR